MQTYSTATVRALAKRQGFIFGYRPQLSVQVQPAVCYRALSSSSTSAGEDHISTRLIHAGQDPDPQTGAVMPPLVLATTYAQASIGNLAGVDMPNSFGKGFEYSRTGNPTRGSYEQLIASSESAKHALAFSSGMSAITACAHLLGTGAHVVSSDDVYGGTQRYFRKICVPQMNQSFTFVDMTDVSAIEAAIRPETKLIWAETPTNPTLKLTDIEAVAAIAKKHNCLLVVDNTFMSPYFQNPLTLGADIVMHSVTKYINGHSDVVGGVLATNDDKINEDLRFIQNNLGGVPGPFDCYQALRGMKTLHLRMERHAHNAMQVAKALEAHSFVDKVAYPGLPSHPQHELAKRQTRGHGGMITFWLKGGLDQVNVFLKSLRIFCLAESLGAVESLAESPALMTHASVPAENRAQLGISDSLIRLSVGCEHDADLLADINRALDAAEASAK